MNVERFHEQMRLGLENRTAGNIDASIISFQSALSIAEALNEKVLQIDAICKIIEICFEKGEIITAVGHIDRAEEILKYTSYMEGRLELFMNKLKISYHKHDFIKVREIGNEAIKICGDNFPLYKGRVLLVLGDAYSEMTDVTEHLSILNQALSCFQEANSLKGILFTVFNMAALYADKLQDNEKALEYYLKTKEKSKEDPSFYAILSTVDVNIGELYFKNMNYKESLYYLKSGLEKCKNSSVESSAFYATCYLIDIYIKLNDLPSAFYYYNIAKGALKDNPYQSLYIIQYYRAVSLLLSEVGQNIEAMKYIKKALDLSGTEESILVWNTGFAYELIKLRGSNSESEVIEGLEGVKFILSKFKNPYMLLDRVYDYAVELVHAGYENYAVNFFKDYENIKSDNEGLILRNLYLEALTLKLESPDKLESIEKAIAAAIKEDNKILEYRLCNSIGHYYFSHNDLIAAKRCYSQANSLLESLLNAVPIEYKTSFAEVLRRNIKIHEL